MKQSMKNAKLLVLTTFLSDWSYVKLQMCVYNTVMHLILLKQISLSYSSFIVHLYVGGKTHISVHINRGCH